MVYGIFETQYEPHPLSISKFRTWENRTIETCNTPPTSHDDDTTTTSSSRQRKNCLPRFMASPPTTVPLALYPSPSRPWQINLAQSSILQRAKLLFRFLKHGQQRGSSGALRRPLRQGIVVQRRGASSLGRGEAEERMK